MVLPVPRVHVEGAALVRYKVKLAVVPDPSERCTLVIEVDGNLTPGLSAAMAGSSQVVILFWKIPAMVAGPSVSLDTPDRWYDTVMGAATVGKYSPPPTYLAMSADAIGVSVPARSTSLPCRSVNPLPDPPPP